MESETQLAKVLKTHTAHMDS